MAFSHYSFDSAQTSKPDYYTGEKYKIKEANKVAFKILTLYYIIPVSAQSHSAVNPLVLGDIKRPEKNYFPDLPHKFSGVDTCATKWEKNRDQGRRLSEIRAMSILPHLHRFGAGNSDVTFLHHLTFIAENQDPTVASGPIVTPALPHNGNWERASLKLCPVLALRWYLSKVDKLCLRVNGAIVCSL